MILFLSITGLLNGIGAIVIGVITLLKRKKDSLSILFILLNLAIAIWALSYWRWFLADTHEKALFWTRMLSIGSTLIPIFFLHWILLLLNMAKKKKWLLVFGYIITVIFLSFSFSPLFVKNVEETFRFPYWPKPGILYHFYVVFSYTFLLGYGVYQLFKAYRAGTGFRKTQIRYVFLGLAIAAPAGFSNFLLWYNINFPPYLNIFVLGYMSCYAYAILKYRLMDIRVIMGKIAVYTISFVSTLALAFLLMFLNEQLARPLPLYLSGSLIVVVSIICFEFFFGFFEKLASKYFYYTFYSYQKVLTNLGKKLVKILDLEELSSLIIDTLTETMKLDRAVLLLKEPEGNLYYIQKNVGFEEKNGISLVKNDFLIEYLKKIKKPLVYEELALFIKDVQDKKELEEIESIKKSMEKIEAVVCLPLTVEKEIIGLIVLGDKISKESYSTQDLELLNDLANQSSIALNNAKTYNELQDLSQNLQEKINEQTKEIKDAYKKVEKAYEVEKKARENVEKLAKQERKLKEKAEKLVQEFEKLDNAKNQFIMATQHHLRTPLTSMIGYVDLLLSGTFGKIPKKIHDVLLKFQSSTSRLGRTVNEFLDISQFQLGRRVISPEANVDIAPILKEMEEEIGFEAENKGIYFKVKKSKLPLITADKNKLKIACFNIADNAIKYTQEGGVTVSAKKVDNKLQIIFKDTGMGLTQEDKESLFSRLFARGAQAQKVFATGRGIGLYLSSQIIQAHGGKIWAESEGRNKGSTFYMEMPLK